MSNKCTLIIDGNWLMMSRFSIIRDEFTLNHSVGQLLSAKKDLRDFMSRSIILQINKLEGIVDNIILVTDGGSWRRYVTKPDTLIEEYKGNRIKDTDIAWDYVFGALSELKESFGSLGITASNAKGVEGDDWCFYWSKYLNSIGTNVIIWSTDGDLKQLVNSESDTWTVWYNNKNGLIINDKSSSDSQDITDYFMNMNCRSILLEKLESKSLKCKKYIKPDNIVMDKVICGDAGDNIKPLMRVKNKSKNYKITPLIWYNIKTILNINNLNDFIDKKSEIVHYMIDNRPDRFKNFNLTYEQVEKEFDYNLKLVWLDGSMIDESVFKSMKESKYIEADLNLIRNNFKMLSGEDNTEEIEEIFEGINDLPF